MECQRFKYLDVTIPVPGDAVRIRQSIIGRLRTDWKPDHIVSKRITGGYINSTMRYHSAGDKDLGDALIVRCYMEDKYIAGWLSHERELLAMQIAHHAGCFPPVVATFNNGVVYKFAAGRNLESVEITDPVIARSVARCLAQLHSVNVDNLPLVDKYGKRTTFPANPTFFGKLYLQLDSLKDANVGPELKERVRKLLPDVAVWRDELQQMETFLEEVGLTRTICHCDVHGRNIVYNEKTQLTTLVDFETTSHGFVAFDFTFMFNFYLWKDILKGFPTGEKPVTDEIRRIWVTSYLQRKYELQNRDPADVTKAEIDSLILELRMLDVVTPLILVIIESCLVEVDGEYLIFRIAEPFMKVYYERKAGLDKLRKEFLKLKSGN